MFEGDHNSHRPQFFYASALIFLNTVLQIDKHLPMAEAEATAEQEGGCVCQLFARLVLTGLGCSSKGQLSLHMF